MPIPKNLTIRLICQNPPDIDAGEGTLTIGVQDKKENVYPALVRADGSLVCECVIEVRVDKETGSPTFYGTFVHGTPATRFLYITWKHTLPTATRFLRRVKVPLSGLTWQLIDSGDAVEGHVDGSRTGTVPVAWNILTAAHSGLPG